MTNRNTADVLHMLADEVADLAGIALELDQSLGALDLKAIDHENTGHFQRVDALHQHLNDVAAILHSMVVLVGHGPQLDIAQLSTGVRLDYIRARLANETPASLATEPDGAVQLF